jgi:hypothetical protein
VKKWFAKAAVAAGLLGMTAGPALAAVPNYMKGYGATQETPTGSGHWSMGGGPVVLNAPSETLTFHVTDNNNNDMVCVFQNAGDIKLDNSVTPNFIILTPSECFKPSGPLVPQPPNAEIVFEAVSEDGGVTYNMNAFIIDLALPIGNVSHFVGTASDSANP